ncbi:MAG TPA: ABC transporter ATP-binding protein [Ktedonobacteraceae bacterium]|nr:ABC transporter ATP-binding protein [Ktedonobacteraceae bacterium]
MKLPIKRYILLLSKYLRPLKLRTTLLAIVLLCGIALQLLDPQILAYFIDTALAGGATITLLLAGLLFILVALANQGVMVVQTYLSQYIAWTATNQLRTDLLAHCLSLDMSFHKARTPGEMIERIDGDVDALSNFFSQFAISLLTSLLLVIAVLFLLWRIDWRVGLALMLFSIGTFLLLMYLRNRAVPLQREQRQMSATFFGFLGEHLAGTEDVRANGATGYVMYSLDRLLRRWRPIYGKAQMAGGTMWVVVMCLFVCANALGFALGAYLWSQELASIGTVYLIGAYISLLSQPIRQIQTQLQDMQAAEACMQRIEELFKISSKLDNIGATEEAELPSGPLSVAFEHVSFGYVEDIPVIHNLSFAVQPGKVLGVLGRTGSGKTTLARLLFRLYDPQSGEIRTGDVPVNGMPLQRVRRRIGMVTQDVQIFHASVRDNLTFFNSTIADEQIRAAIHDAGLTPWFSLLPDGLDTMLGSDGAGISAGEAQLLAFTRVLLTDPGLIILDEASSRLDPATENRIEHAINKLFAGRTAIVIAHRLATIQRADDILLIENGHILEYGNRELLASDPTTHFAHLLQTGLEEVLA